MNSWTGCGWRESLGAWEARTRTSKLNFHCLGLGLRLSTFIPIPLALLMKISGADGSLRSLSNLCVCDKGFNGAKRGEVRVFVHNLLPFNGEVI